MEKEYDEAIRLLELAISEHGATYVAEERLAEIYRDKGELDKALNLFMSVVDRLQGNSRSVILKQIGLIYVEKKDFASAKDYFVSASKINSSDYQALYFAGFCNEIEGNYDKAANYYEQALDLRYDFSFARKRLAIVYINEKLFDKAKELLDDFDEKGMDVDYYIIKSMLYSKQDNFAKAVDILAGALEMFPSSMELMFELSTLYEKLKKYDECENILKQALALEPENPIFLNFLGYLYAELNIKLKEAYKMIERAIKKDPENPAYMDSMAWVLYKMKKYNKAYEWQKKALKSGAKEDEYIQHMNAILEALGVKKSIDEVIKEN
jgi:tetratricopeptide (TPR) repeat protein